MVYLSNYYCLDEYYNTVEHFEMETKEPSTIILIHNEKEYHYEIIESILLLSLSDIIRQNTNNPIFYLDLKGDNPSFKDYISSKYENIKWGRPDFYHYYIELSFYKEQLPKIKTDNRHFYIGHEVSEDLEKYKNVYFLSPFSQNRLSCHYLPFRDMKPFYKTDIPIYIVQGNLDEKRRDFSLLTSILSHSYPRDFRIKLIGRGEFPSVLQPFSDKIIFKNNLNFQEYHQEFLDGYCLLPLISRENNIAYYKNKLTSSVNYIISYNLKSIIDSDLQEIYNLNNAYIYRNSNEIQNVFFYSLMEFYKN